MKLLVVSHKECWPEQGSPSGYATVGGFPFQMQVLAELFDQTVLCTTLREGKAPTGIVPLEGHNMRVAPLPEPHGRGLGRKLGLVGWLPRHLATLWRLVHQADAVHALVPGDVGFLGLMAALAQHKPLFVRHCGTWGEPVTWSDRLLLWLLERRAGGRTVVMATGGAEHSPSVKNPHIQWIFSTTLSEVEAAGLPQASPWHTGQPLRLASVGRLTPGKNVAAILGALPQIKPHHPQVHLDVVGGGEMLDELRVLAANLGVSGQVTLHGNLPHAEVLQLLSQAHLFVFPTRVKEGFPKAVLEALACGLPVIATPVSVVPHLLRQGCGLLLDGSGPDEVAAAIVEATSNEARLAEMATKARQVARGYSLEAWQATIAERLRQQWGALRQDETFTSARKA